MCLLSGVDVDNLTDAVDKFVILTIWPIHHRWNIFLTSIPILNHFESNSMKGCL